MDGAQTKHDRRTDEYEIRRFRPDDRESYLALCGTVYSAKPGEWFDWRYAAPSLDHVPIFVAVADGVVAGAEAFLPYRLRAGDEETLALQPADAMVHPDHRRRGLFTRITEAAIEYYDDREPTHFFNFPTPAARPALEKLGWRTVGTIPTWYRVSNPRAVLADRVPRPALTVASRAAKAAADGYCRLRDRATDEPTTPVERYDGVPAETLAALAECDGSGTIRVRHDEQFYRWGFANPCWDAVTTYLARSDDESTAAVVAATRRAQGVTVTKVLDAVPDGRDRPDAFAAPVAALVDDAADSDLLAVATGTLPTEVLVERGFVSDDHPFLSTIRTPTDLVVRPIDSADGWRLGGRSLAELDDWRLTFADQDTPF